MPVDAKPISDYVNLRPDADPRLKNLVHNIFHKVAMVKEY